MTKPINGDKSAAGLLNIEYFSINLTGVRTGSINKDNRLLSLSPPLNQERSIYNSNAICNIIKNV
nr:hypothetical protein [Anaerocolumna xylanovorans]